MLQAGEIAVGGLAGGKTGMLLLLVPDRCVLVNSLGIRVKAFPSLKVEMLTSGRMYSRSRRSCADNGKVKFRASL